MLAVQFFIITVFHAHIHHGRESSTKSSGETSFIQRDIFKRIAIKYREEAEHVIHVVQRQNPAVTSFIEPHPARTSLPSLR